MTVTPPYYPIIYVRGFAATMGEIEDTVATPYMGFNLGATKIRQDYKGEILRFIFESPLIRLMKDEGYTDVYREGDFIPAGERVPAKSIWIFRYYEPSSESLGEGERLDIPGYARDLRAFILRVREQVCGDDAKARRRFKVYLVAHSMGGLICRCYLQNLCIHGSGEADSDRDLELPGDSLVDKVFTYATPHNGIEFRGVNVPDLGWLSRLHIRNFNRGAMREYLRLPADSERVDSLNGAFPEQRFFCLVGTNYDDYTAFFNLSRKGTGPMSDGLVMIANATVSGAPRAFVHRSHSGHYGIVNSEEGYQNLRRFLFGQVRVDVFLVANEITLPPPLQEQLDKGRQLRASYHIETGVRVRGATYYLHERRVDQSSAILADYDKLLKRHDPIYLFSGYLYRAAKTAVPDTALAFALSVGIQVPTYEIDRRFWFNDHFEGGYLLNETLTFHVRRRGDKTTVAYGLASEQGLGQATRHPERRPREDGGVEISIPLGFREGMANPPRPGFRGHLILQAGPS